LGQFVDHQPPTGKQVYALVVVSEDGSASQASFTIQDVPPAAPPPVPTGLRTLPSSASVRLRWEASPTSVAGYHVYRGLAGGLPSERITVDPILQAEYYDASVQPDTAYVYAVRAISVRGLESAASSAVEALPRVIDDEMFAADLAASTQGSLHGEGAVSGKLHGRAEFSEGSLNLQQQGHVTFPHHAYFDVNQPLTVECQVWFDKQGTMPVLIGCGNWNQAGWFLQWLGNRWRWHVGGIDCDGGRPETGRWIHLAGVYDGQKLRLFQDGVQVAEKAGRPSSAVWPGELYIGQYSGSPGPNYQLHGRIKNVKLYHHALDATE
jgi:hypothetical protein